MTYKKIIICALICLLFINMQCNEDDVAITPCGLETVVHNTAYNEAESHAIDSAIINGDCININISDSGCDGNSWVMTLIDSEAIAESMPPQRYLKLKLVNEELCSAIVDKEVYFDLLPLRLEGTNEVLLNIEGVESSILYTY